MAEFENLDELRSKHKAVMALLLYAVLQEREGQPEMLDMLLRAVRASRTLDFTWYRIKPFAMTLFSKATPRALVLALPCIAWGFRSPAGWQSLVHQWAAATSAVPHTEEVAQSVVDALLCIASLGQLSPYITVDVWSWLTRRPPLPPVCWGRYLGTSQRVVNTVRRLKDAEILKAYLLLAWSEWDSLQELGFRDMCTSMREDFCGIGMDCHRADLIQRLNHILKQLDRGLVYLKQHNPNLDERSLQVMEYQYQKLREILLEINTKGIACKSSYPMVVVSVC